MRSSVFYEPTFANLEFKYFGKSYYVNRTIIEFQSNLISKNPSLNFLILPSIKGQINELIAYLYGQNVNINRKNAFFFDIMSSFLEFKDEKIQTAARQFLPVAPTPEMISEFFISQKEITFSTLNCVKYKFFFIFLNEFFSNDQNAFIPYFSVNYLLEEGYALRPQTQNKILDCLLNELQTIEPENERYKEIERTIINFIEKFQRYQLFERILKCPFFDISKISVFKNFLSQISQCEKYPDESGRGFFESVKGKSDSPTFFCEKLSDTVPLNERSIMKMTFSYFFNDFTFEIDGYSLKLDENKDPLNLSLLVSSDNKDFIEIHSAEEVRITGDVTKFKVNKTVNFVRSLKLVMIQPFNQESPPKLDEAQFDIFGTYHKSAEIFTKPQHLLSSTSSSSSSEEDVDYDGYYDDDDETIDLDDSISLDF